MITDQKLKSALAVLTDHEGDYSRIRASHDYLQKMEKIVLSDLISKSNEKTQSAKEHWARCQPQYRHALEQTREVAELDFKNRARREAAAAIVETWRTEQSNMRAHVGTDNVRKRA